MAAFELFRFQLLPASQERQQELFGETLSLEELKERKNELFARVLAQDSRTSRSPDLLQKVLVEGHPEWMVMKIAPRRKAILNKPDFRTEQVEDWPYVTLFLNNDPEVQVIGVSRNQRAFKNTYSVVRALERRLEKPLRSVGLTVQFSSIYDRAEFWSIIENYTGRVEKVRFEMVAPNMANISRVLKVDLKRLNQEANAQRTTLELEAVGGTSLEIDKADELVSGCVDYSAEGGGDIKVKIKGMRKIIRTSTSVRVLELDEAIFENTTPDELDLLLKGVLK